MIGALFENFAGASVNGVRLPVIDVIETVLVRMTGGTEPILNALPVMT